MKKVSTRSVATALLAVAARIGGDSVMVSEGELTLD